MTHPQCRNVPSIPALPPACNKIEWDAVSQFEIFLRQYIFSSHSGGQIGIEARTCLPSSYDVRDNIGRGVQTEGALLVLEKAGSYVKKRWNNTREHSRQAENEHLPSFHEKYAGHGRPYTHGTGRGVRLIIPAALCKLSGAAGCGFRSQSRHSAILLFGLPAHDSCTAIAAVCMLRLSIRRTARPRLPVPSMS